MFRNQFGTATSRLALNGKALYERIVNRPALLKGSLFAAVCALWIGVIVACSNDRPQESRVDETPEAREPAPEPVREPPPPPPAPPPTTAADGGQAASSDGGAATAATCTGRGDDLCPLQAFMKRTLQPAVKAGRGVAELTKVAGWAPDPSWNEGERAWRATAEAAAAAAREGDRARLQAACKACHTAWQKRYKAEFRTRPVPAS